MFCGTWKAGLCRLWLHQAIYLMKISQEFDFVFKSYCRKNRFGDRHVRRDDYEVIRAQDSQIIDPSELATTVEPGMVLEISIFLRQNMALQDDKTKCLRCGHINPDAHDWIHWKVPLNYRPC